MRIIDILKHFKFNKYVYYRHIKNFLKNNKIF